MSQVMCEERESVVLQNKNQKIFGVLHRPVTEKRVPAIVICHGYGGNKSGSNRIYVNQAQRLTEIGVAVLRIDFRCCGDSEGNFFDLTIDGQVSDALLALQFLSKHPSIDSDRLGLLGCSLGGAISVLTAEQYRCIKSLALWAPVANGQLWAQEWGILNPSVSLEEHFKGRETGVAFYQQFQMLCLKKSLEQLDQVVLLHIQGEQDKVVSLEHRNHYQKWRCHLPEKNRFLTLAMSDHHFSHTDERQTLFHETTRWFQGTL